ncbi:NAD(P)-binding protein [Ceratobasidium sp. AG-I]|nr:NAD(P)-binding protein [Ceratobasidium sp. AG-I]
MARVAIITGAAQGIGRAIALRLANDGIDVAVNDIPEKQNELNKLVEEIEAIGRKAVAVPADVANEVEVQAMVKQAVDVLGGLDVMVANAGIIIKSESILDLTEEIFDKVMSVNCKGVLFCYRAAAIQMIKQGRGGRIIGASSLAGIKGGSRIVSYSTSKFAVRAITQTAALEWGQHNITVNAYAPGLISTEMTANAAKRAGKSDFQDLLLKGSCMTRYGEAEEVASLVGFLASEGSSYVTGSSNAQREWGSSIELGKSA